MKACHTADVFLRGWPVTRKDSGEAIEYVTLMFGNLGYAGEAQTV